MATSVTDFISFEAAGCGVGTAFLALFRQRAVIAVLRIVAIVHVAIEFLGATKPGSGADEDTAIEPLRAVVTVGSAAIRSVIIVAIGAYRRDSDINDNLSFCCGSGCDEADSSNSS